MVTVDRPDRVLEELAARLSTTPVIILTWNGWEAVLACLQSIRDAGGEHLVWLVDNGSDEDRAPEALVLSPNLRTFRWEENRGWAGGYNPVLRLARREGYDFVYLLNDDCTVTPGFLAPTLAVALQHDDIALVGSAITDMVIDGSLGFDGTRGAPTTGAGRRGGAALVAEAHGAGMLVRLRALDSVGYFAERYFCYGEETEWCRRARRQGWQIAVTDESLVYHRGAASDVSGNARYYRTRNGFLLLDAAGSGSSWGSRTRYAYRAWRAANETRRLRHPETANAIAAGLWDGWRGRDGRRGEPPPWPVRHLFTHCWPFPAGFFRRERAT